MQAVVAAVPAWLLWGVALGLLFTLAIVVAFVLGSRAFPDSRSAGANGTEERRRAEVREYLLDIEERFLEDHDLGGHRVAFFLPDRGVAITFDAQVYFRLDRSDVHPVLLEYELPGHRIGSRLPFDPPDLPANPADDPAEAFSILGLDPSASIEEVRSAYRERVKEAHPDHGGDAESFERVREAYAVARERARS